MDRINHVKIVTPDPDAVDRFLREVLDFPEGWNLGEPTTGQRPPSTPPTSPARDASGRFTHESVAAFRGSTTFRGMITGSPDSRQFQILQGDTAHIWAVAVGTRNLERAHDRCVERGIACTDLDVTKWGEGGIRFFFAEVGGIVFEVMRVEDSA